MYNSLKALKKELELTLQRVQSELKSYLENPTEVATLETAAAGIDQVRGAFTLLEWPDAAALTREMAALALELTPGNRENVESLQLMLLQAVLQLPACLERLQEGSCLPSLDCWSLTNELRAVRGLAPLAAELERVALKADTALGTPAVNLRELATPLHPLLQRALLSMLRGKEVADSLETIARIFYQLQEAVPDEPSYRFWWLAEGLVREIQNGSILFTPAVHLLLRDLDKQFKYLCENGQVFSSSAAEQDFRQRLSDCLASSRSGLARLQNQTDYHPPQPARTATPWRLPDPGNPLTDGTIRKIASLLQESLKRIEEALESFAQARKQRNKLYEAAARLHAMVNVLCILNVNNVNNVNTIDIAAGLLQHALKVLQQWLVTDDIPAEHLVQLASELILVEDNLQDSSEWAYGPAISPAAELNAADRRELLAGSYQRSKTAAIQVAVQLMEQAREFTAAALENQGEPPLWNNLSIPLHSIGGALEMLECEQTAALMKRLEKLVCALADRQPDGLLDSFAEIMLTLEYHLELLGDGKRPDDAILQGVEDRLNPLDHWLAVPPSPPDLSATADPEILEIFFEEAQDELANIRENLVLWRNNLTDNVTDNEALLSIRRSFHTLKGSGRMVQQFIIGDFAWCFENLLNHIRDGKLAPSLQLVELVDEAQSVLRPLVGEGHRDGSEAATMATLTTRAEALLQRGELPTAAVQPQPVAAMPLAPPLEVLLQELAAEEQITAIPASSPAPAAPVSAVAAEVDSELIKIFQYEAAEILDSSDLILEHWKEDQANDELLNDLRRTMHTLKGSSRMAGFMVIGDLAHAMESVLDKLSTHSVQDMAAVVDTLQRALDRLNSMLAEVHQGGGIPPADDLIRTLKMMVSEPATGKPPPSAPWQQGFTAAAAGLDTALASAAQAATALTELDREVVEVFQSEAAEILDSSDVTLRRWNADKENSGLLNDLRRQMHTLKGSARMAGFPVIGDLAHAMESVLDTISKGELVPSETAVDTLQRALDGLNERVVSVQSGVKPTPAQDLISHLRAQLSEAPREKTRPVASDRERLQQPAKPALAVEDTIRVSTTLLNKLIDDMGESSICRARVDQGLVALRFNLSELDQTVYRLRQQLRHLEIETEAQISFRYEKSTKEHEKEFDPLELDRFSALQQFSRPLMEIVEDLSNIKSTLEDQAQEMGNLLDQQAKVHKEIQQGLMRTRTVRFNKVEPRLCRVVRQAAQELGKRAELLLEGAESEVDRIVLENIVAPLEHMLRNAISHGIEIPEQRLAMGKPEVGTITLTLRREGAELVLNLKDDGAGLNFAAIRAKGEALGLLKPGQTVIQDELIALLLRPGFTTVAEVTQISGRGVGMDVLNNAIKTMRGALLIQTEQGKGTSFIIRLPFSLVVTQALLVQVGHDTYAVPLLSIESVARLDEDKLRTYLAGESVEYQYGEHRYSLHNLGILFGADSIKPYDEILDKRPPLLLFRNAEASAALQVDAVLGNQEIIVKPLGPQFQSVIGISGATILGDGRVVVILDLAALVRNLTSQSQRQAEALALDVARQEGRPEGIRAMVVDDSVTMRRVTSRFLERHHIQVTVAKDGLEAVAKLEEQLPDLVILDIEMPRMDGFELAAHIRNQPRLQHIPIIMVTSRGGKKHRERAAKLGVNDYLTKPYQEEDMLNSIRHILGERFLQLCSKPVF
jgi:chemosensory pili system protein ChpA (sensor histidine kinase/response regulator)